jgi:GntR family transcriptional regulator
MLPSASIDRGSPVPFYFQLAELLEHEIISGRWEPGLRLPSEHDFCRHFDVSRTTLRQALSRLEQEGLISRHKGCGTFVQGTRPRSWMLQSSGGFFEDEVARKGRRVTSRVRRATRGVLPGWACDALSLPVGSIGSTLERIRSVDGLVAMYVVNHLPDRFADAVEPLEGDASLYQRLRERYGVEPAGGRRVVEAMAAQERLARLLQVQPNTPLIFVQSVTWDDSGQPFDCYQAWLRSDRMKVEVDVLAVPAATRLNADQAWGNGSDGRPELLSRRPT